MSESMLIVAHGGKALCEYEIVPADDDAVRDAVGRLQTRRADQTQMTCFVIATPIAREPVKMTAELVERVALAIKRAQNSDAAKLSKDGPWLAWELKLGCAALTAALGQHGGEADGPTETGKVEDAAAMLCGALMAERLGGSCDKSAREYENELVALLVGNAASPPNAESVGEKSEQPEKPATEEPGLLTGVEEAEPTEEERRAVCKAFDALETMADEWAEKIDLQQLAIGYMRQGVDAVVNLAKLAWTEGAYTGRTSLATYPRKHVWWGAGEPDCPRDIKASNGELHTLRCKVCGQNGNNDLCPGAATPSTQLEEDHSIPLHPNAVEARHWREAVAEVLLEHADDVEIEAPTLNRLIGERATELAAKEGGG